MSRTVRRVGKSLNSYDEKGYTTDYDEDHAKANGGWKSYIDYHTRETKWYFTDVAWGGQKLIKKRGKEYRKGWWYFHSDKMIGHCYYQMSWGTVRNKNRQDLNRWIYNSDHEPIFYEEQNRKEWN